ncbi:MAG: hypothetical protein JXA28_11265, partial [Bacteroidetes bacterium]|nr:hypothetical protein [Bacteroidota bacterium]
ELSNNLFRCVPFLSASHCCLLSIEMYLKTYILAGPYSGGKITFASELQNPAIPPGVATMGTMLAEVRLASATANSCLDVTISPRFSYSEKNRSIWLAALCTAMNSVHLLILFILFETH